MSPEVAALLARITQGIDALHWTESRLRTQRAILREQATALRLGVPPTVVAARLKAEKCWTLGTVEAQAP